MHNQSMRDAFDAIIACRNDSGKLAKENFLRVQEHNLELKEFLRLAYEPRVNFFVSKIDQSFSDGQAQPGTLSLTNELLIEIQDTLSARKITGHAAKTWLANIRVGLEHDWEKELLDLLIGRDVKSGFNVSTINKVWNELITDIPYMRCCLPKEAKLKTWPWARGIYSEIKTDGMFANIDHHDDSSVTIISRAGAPFPLEFFEKLILEVKDKVPLGHRLNGELLMLRLSDKKILPRQIGNGMFNKIAQEGVLEEEDQGCIAVYDAWDLVPLSECRPKNKYNVKYSVRFEKLLDCLDDTINSPVLRVIEYKMVRSMKEAYEHYKECLERGLEGTVVKHPDMIWEDTTSKFQVKLKLEADCELRIKKFNPGNGKNEKLFGSIECVSEDGKIVVNVSGFKDDVRKKFSAERDTMIDKIMTVRSNFLLEPARNKQTYSLFLPRHIEIRHDKTEADTLEKVIAQFDAAIKAVTDLE